MPTSRAATKKVVPAPWRASRSRHSLLLQMAADAEKLAGQAQRLTELKKLARVTNREISETVGVTERQIQRWLAGDSDIDGHNLKKVAEFFGTTPDFIEYGEERSVGPTPALFGVSQLDRIEAKLDQILEQLSQPPAAGAHPAPLGELGRRATSDPTSSADLGQAATPAALEPQQGTGE